VTASKSSVLFYTSSHLSTQPLGLTQHHDQSLTAVLLLSAAASSFGQLFPFSSWVSSLTSPYNIPLIPVVALVLLTVAKVLASCHGRSPAAPKVTFLNPVRVMNVCAMFNY
jgi:hypothetical protein